ncbi:hypothetical protein KY284_032417 [Solanum tuberosum]|nr:hypothetical protein KY284_032417 [Solanum tuberosum]
MRACTGHPHGPHPSLSNLSHHLWHWPDGDAERYCSNDNLRNEDDYAIQMFGSDEELSSQIPTQAQTLVEGSGSVLVSEYKPVPDVDYLQELLAIQQQGPRNIGFFGTRNMGFMHQELIEILSYALVITKNHIFTSGAAGTNAAVIRGALRAEKPELLTVILPQSLEKQPPESQELLSKECHSCYLSIKEKKRTVIGGITKQFAKKNISSLLFLVQMLFFLSSPVMNNHNRCTVSRGFNYL